MCKGRSEGEQMSSCCDDRKPGGGGEGGSAAGPALFTLGDAILPLRLFRSFLPRPTQTPTLDSVKQENSKTRWVQALICEHRGLLDELGMISWSRKGQSFSVQVAPQNCLWICSGMRWSGLTTPGCHSGRLRLEYNLRIGILKSFLGLRLRNVC